MNTTDDPELVLASVLRAFPFVEVGLALARVRDQRLYRAEFQTFKAYCQPNGITAGATFTTLCLRPNYLRKFSPTAKVPNPAANRNSAH